MLSKMIGLYTRQELNHVSIAFDEQLHDMYSFGRKQKYNPFIGGFVKEDVENGILQHAQCAIFCHEVTTEQFIKIRTIIQNFEKKKETYSYNFIGLLGIPFKIEIQRKKAYFCSQFVATVIKKSGVPMFSMKPAFVQPHHFQEIPYLQQVYEGDMQNYLQKMRHGKANDKYVSCF